jgi:hypothetical protein
VIAISEEQGNEEQDEEEDLYEVLGLSEDAATTVGQPSNCLLSVRCASCKPLIFSLSFLRQAQIKKAYRKLSLKWHPGQRLQEQYSSCLKQNNVFREILGFCLNFR